MSVFWFLKVFLLAESLLTVRYLISNPMIFDAITKSGDPLLVPACNAHGDPNHWTTSMKVL